MSRRYLTYCRKQIKSCMANNLSTVGLSVISINLHGFGQGGTFLKELCESKKYDIIFVLEHWLYPSTMHKIQNIDENYTCFGKSGMETALSKGFLKGRPYSGTAVLVRSTLQKAVTHVEIFERIVTVQICNILFIATYMPCEDGSVESLNTLHEVLANISIIIEQSSAQYLIFGGDLNVNLKATTPHSAAINDFLQTYKMLVANDRTSLSAGTPAPAGISTDIKYTFSNEKRSAYSIIDFICVSKSVINDVFEYDTVDSASNFSDHLAVKMCCTLPASTDYYKFITTGCLTDVPVIDKSKDSQKDSLRWDHCDTDLYYACSGNVLYPLYNEIVYWYDYYVNNSSFSYKSDCNFSNCEQFIDDIYKRTVRALNDTARACVPRMKPGVLKHWWNSSLTELKKLSMASFELWAAAGKPKFGPIYLSKNSDKLKYKNAIKKTKATVESSISNELHEALVYKEPVQFWKTWKSKVCAQSKNKIVLEGIDTDLAASEAFRNYFSGVCTPNNEHFNACKQKEFNDAFRCYKNNYAYNPLNCWIVNAELVGIAIAKIEKGKAAGFDSLTLEHLTNCHPIIYSLLAKLFSLMLISSSVPSDFGMGITIPIPKEDRSTRVHNIENFRGITLSPIISKVFEHCLLIMFQKHLRTSDNQFAFKANTGCSNAIYVLRNVVDFYIENDTTVNLGCLDISKAFDKLNYYVLFIKLMKRNMPSNVVELLLKWYSLSYNCVRWGAALSEPFRLLAGVRQGGVLSPALFAVYVDDLLIKLNKFGCTMFGLSVGALMYADDVILISPSVSELQNMILICCEELALLDLSLNLGKSVALRMGKGWKRNCCALMTSETAIKWVNETRYLGLYLMSGPKFSCNFEKTKIKYYRAANAILARLGKQENPTVTVHLLQTMAFPIISYALEALRLNKTKLVKLEHPWSRAFMKIFNTFDNTIVVQCQLFTGVLPLRHQYTIRAMAFYANLKISENSLCREIFNSRGEKDVNELALRYCKDRPRPDFDQRYRDVVIKFFEDDIK